MAEITAKMVQELRSKTGISMMDCKKALAATNGDVEAAIEHLRVAGNAKMAARSSSRSTEFGRIAIAVHGDVGAMVELKCESAPVAGNAEFAQLAQDMAEAMVKQPAASAEELMGFASTSKPGTTIREQCDELANRIREVFRVGRILRVDGKCTRYLHHTNDLGVLLVCQGEVNEATGTDVCMQIAAMCPAVIAQEDLDPAIVEKERRIQIETLKNDPANAKKPEAILAKIVDGRMHNFFAEQCLLDQEYVKEAGKTIRAFIQETAPAMTVVAFHRWKVGE